MKKNLDAMAMKRKAQEQIYEETKDLPRDEEIEHLHRAGERFWHEVGVLRERMKSRPRRKPKKKTPAL
jgi:hypothetical protein